MTQVAQVKTILSDGRAEVGVHRRSACSHDCSKCSGCELMMTKTDVTVTAENHVGARPGDTVLVESANSAILGTAVVVYLVPFLLFFVGYFLGHAIAAGETISIGLACAGFVAGILPARWLDHRVNVKKAVQFRIVEIMKSCSDM